MAEVASIREIINGLGLSGTVTTRGGSDEGDGGALTYVIRDTVPSSQQGRDLALETADGMYAVPLDLPTSPPRGPMPASVWADVARRGWTFVNEGGTDLIWDNTRTGPGLNPQPVHQVLQAPYPITCSHYTGLLLHGYEYASTTYVAGRNTRVGRKVSFQGRRGRDTIFQAHNQGRNLFDLGHMWLTDGTDIAPGDLLYFSQRDPEGSWAGVRAGTVRPYWGNIYHVALYMGGSTVLQSATRLSPTGVYEASLDEGFLASHLHLAARPPWLLEPGVLAVVTDGGWEQQLV